MWLLTNFFFFFFFFLIQISQHHCRPDTAPAKMSAKSRSSIIRSTSAALPVMKSDPKSGAQRVRFGLLGQCHCHVNWNGHFVTRSHERGLNSICITFQNQNQNIHCPSTMTRKCVTLVQRESTPNCRLIRFLTQSCFLKGTFLRPGQLQ